MAQQQAIKLKIAGKSYSFTLKHEANEEQSLAEKEELYRLAEREVNAYVTPVSYTHLTLPTILRV